MEYCIWYISVGISEINFIIKVFGWLFIIIFYIIELYVKYNKENVVVIDGFVKWWLVMNKR